MNTIARTAYGNDNIHTRPQANPTHTATETTAAGRTTAVETTAPADRVTLSPRILTARTRESMGLSPTGALKLEDFGQVAKQRAATVNTRLKQTIQQLGIDPKQAMTLSLDGKGNIAVAEKFAGKNDLVKALNEDTAFTGAFRQMTANTELLTQVAGMGKTTTSLAEVMNSKADWEDILSLAKRHKNLQNSKDPLATLVDMAHRESPYAHTYDPTA